MAHIVGCVEAHELSTCKQGANQLAHHILRKSMTPKDNSTPEAEPAEAETEKTMNVAEIQKAAANLSLKLAKLSAVAQKHILSLSDDAAHDLLVGKSVEEIEDVAKTADEAAKKRATEEEAAKAGVSARELELQKRLDDQKAELEALKAKDAERDIEKRAATEFAGYPGGVTEAVSRLKTIAKLPADERGPLEDMMKAQCAQALAATKNLGGRTEEEVSKAVAAKTRLDTAAKAYAEEKKVDLAKAMEAISEMREHAADVEIAFG